MTPSLHAFHEAGHCVAAHAIGLEYGAILFDDKRAQAGPDAALDRPATAEQYGQRRLDAGYQADTLENVMRDALVTAAGVVAEAMATCKSSIILYGADHRMIEAAARSLPYMDHEGERCFAGMAVARARNLLHERWPAVERVAQALEERRRLSSADVASLMN